MSKTVNQSRPLESVESSELRLELHLRAGPRYQCQDPHCKSYEDGPSTFDCCPNCGKKGFLSMKFKLDKSSPQYQQWLERTFAQYRGFEDQPKKGD